MIFMALIVLTFSSASARSKPMIPHMFKWHFKTNGQFGCLWSARQALKGARPKKGLVGDWAEFGKKPVLYTLATFHSQPNAS